MQKEKEKKKSGKLFCGNNIAEIEGKKKKFNTFFFPSISTPQFFFRNDTSTIFLQQILSGRLLLIIIIGAKK